MMLLNNDAAVYQCCSVIVEGCLMRVWPVAPAHQRQLITMPTRRLVFVLLSYTAVEEHHMRTCLCTLRLCSRLYKTIDDGKYQHSKIQ